MSSNSYAFLLALAVAGFTFLAHLKGTLRRTPLLIHNASWIIALTIIGSGLLHYTSVAVYAWILITGGIAVFNIGMLMPGHLRESPLSPAGQPPSLAAVSHGEFTVLLGGYTVGFGLYLGKVASIFGISALLHNPTQVRAEAGLVLAVFPLYAKLLTYLGPMLFVIILNRWAVKPALSRRWTAVVFIYLLVSFLATLQRTTLFAALAWEIAILLLRPSAASNVARRIRTHLRRAIPRQGRRRVLSVFVLGALGLAAFQFLGSALHKTGSNDPELQANVSPVLQGTQWASLFEYASSGIPAFSQLIESPNHDAPPGRGASSAPIVGDYNPQTWGRATFQAFLKVVPAAPPWDPVGPFASIPFKGNVYTWYEPYFRDFRGPGVILLAFFSGLAVGGVALRRARSGSWLLMAGLLVGVTAFAPFANRFIEDYTIEYLLLLVYFNGFGSLHRRHVASHRRLGVEVSARSVS